MTNDTKIGTARQIAQEISGIKGIANCIVDDWDDYGGFRLFARLDFKRLCDGWFPVGQIDLRSIHARIRGILKTHNALQNYINNPKRKYDRHCGRFCFVGYNDTYVAIDFSV